MKRLKNASHDLSSYYTVDGDILAGWMGREGAPEKINCDAEN